MPRTSEALSPLCTWSRVYWVPPSPPSKDFLDQWIAANNSQMHQKDSTGTLGALKKVAEWGVVSEISLSLSETYKLLHCCQAVSEPSLSGWPSGPRVTPKNLNRHINRPPVAVLARLAVSWKLGLGPKTSPRSPKKSKKCPKSLRKSKPFWCWCFLQFFCPESWILNLIFLEHGELFCWIYICWELSHVHRFLHCDWDSSSLVRDRITECFFPLQKARVLTAACFSIINYSCKKWGKNSKRHLQHFPLHSKNFL